MIRKVILLGHAVDAARKIGKEALQEMSREQAASAIFAQVIEEQGMDLTNPRIDWEMLLSFLERLLPLILLLIGK